MKVIIYGAGAIGSVVGGHLGRSGQEVVLIGRPGYVKAVNEKGLRLVMPTTTYTVKVRAVTSPKQIDFKPDDVVFLTMKGQNTEEALRDLKAVAPDVPVFCLQNGVRNEETASQYFKRVYGVTVYIDALYLTEGEVTCHRDPPGGLIIGRYPSGTDKLCETVAQKLRDAGFVILVSPDVMANKWGKLTLNLGNAVTGITNAKGNEADFIINAARAELTGMLAEAGIHVNTRAELVKQEPEFIRQITPKTDKPENHSQGSTWQSLSRRQGSVETEYLNGEAVRLAKKLGKKAPINEKIAAICCDMGVNRVLPGKYSPAELGAILGLQKK